MKKSFFAAVTSFMLGGCQSAAVAWPHDIKLIAVERVAAPRYAYDPTPFRETIKEEFINPKTGSIRVASPAEVATYFQHNPALLKRREIDQQPTVLKVTFSSATDLVKLMQDQHFQNYNTYFFVCSAGAPDLARPEPYSDIYLQGFRVERSVYYDGPLDAADAVTETIQRAAGPGAETYQQSFIRKDRLLYRQLVSNRANAAPIIYTMYVSLQGKGYNLVQQPEDLCFSMTAMTGTFGQLQQSGVLLTIPKTAISAALQ